MTTVKKIPLPKNAMIAVAATAALSAAAYGAYRFYRKYKAEQEAADAPASAPSKDWDALSKDLYKLLGSSGMKAMARAGLELSESGQTASNLQGVASKALGADTFAKASGQGIGFAQAGTRLLGADIVTTLNKSRIAVRSAKVSGTGARKVADAMVASLIGPDMLKKAQGKLQFVQG